MSPNLHTTNSNFRLAALVGQETNMVIVTFRLANCILQTLKLLGGDHLG